MPTDRKRLALITGASTGIGFEFARLFAKTGHSLVLVSKDAARLHHAAGGISPAPGCEIICLPCDLGLAHSPDALYEEITSRGLEVDILINNAGFGVYGAFSATDLAAESELLQVNIAALTRLTKLFLPGMMRRRSGRILNVASTAAFQPGPLMAVYYASKAYVLSFSEAIAEELKGSGVSVTCLCPGVTQTNFVERAKLQSSALFQNRKLMTAAEVAETGYRSLMQGKPVVIAGNANAFKAFMVRFVPRSLLLKTVRKMQEEKRKK